MNSKSSEEVCFEAMIFEISHHECALFEIITPDVKFFVIVDSQDKKFLLELLAEPITQLEWVIVFKSSHFMGDLLKLELSFEVACSMLDVDELLVVGHDSHFFLPLNLRVQVVDLDENTDFFQVMLQVFVLDFFDGSFGQNDRLPRILEGNLSQ